MKRLNAILPDVFREIENAAKGNLRGLFSDCTPNDRLAAQSEENAKAEKPEPGQTETREGKGNE